MKSGYCVGIVAELIALGGLAAGAPRAAALLCGATVFTAILASVVRGKQSNEGLD